MPVTPQHTPSPHSLLLFPTPSATVQRTSPHTRLRSHHIHALGSNTSRNSLSVASAESAMMHARHSAYISDAHTFPQRLSQSSRLGSSFAGAVFCLKQRSTTIFFFFFLMIRPPPRSPLFPYTTLSR